MPALEIEEVLRDPETSPWLRTALSAALHCDPVDAAADAAKLAKVLERRLAETLRQEIRSETSGWRPRARPAAA